MKKLLLLFFFGLSVASAAGAETPPALPPQHETLVREIEWGNEDKAAAILKQNPELFKSPRSLLEMAIYRGRKNLVVLWLMNGLDVNSTNERGQTPLHVAAGMRGESTFFIELFLAAGADPMIKDNDGQIALHKAAASGNRDAVRLLRGHGAKDNHGETPLTAAVVGFDSNKGFVEQMVVLSRGEHNIFAATFLNRLDEVRKLLAREPELAKQRTRWGTTALYLAVQSDQLEIARLLLKNGADPNAGDSSHYMATPLMLARSEAMKQALKQYGASMQIGQSMDPNFRP